MEEAVTLFAFDDYFPAVATTDLLARVADVLCAKPSELGPSYTLGAQGLIH